jgi:hypothetical protein
MPRACAAMPMRPPSSVAMAILKPSPFSPSTFSLGTFTFSKNTVHECAAWMPSLWSRGFCVKPGVPLLDDEGRGALGAERSVVRGEEHDVSAWGPLVIQFLAPLTTK